MIAFQRETSTMLEPYILEENSRRYKENTKGVIRMKEEKLQEE